MNVWSNCWLKRGVDKNGYCWDGDTRKGNVAFLCVGGKSDAMKVDELGIKTSDERFCVDEVVEIGTMGCVCLEETEARMGRS